MQNGINIMENDIQKKLNLLRRNFAKKVPAKLEKMDLAWQLLQKEWTRDNLYELQRQAHNLKGSAATFKYLSLSEAAERLEYYTEQDPKPNNTSKLDQLLADIKAAWRKEK